MADAICYIIGAGTHYGLDFIPAGQDLVIAADGGLERLREAGITPDLIVGDFDSLGRIPDGCVVRLPKEKDVTDTWAAVELGRQRGFRRFFLYGCTGGRMDHTLANLQTAAMLAEQGAECRIFGQTQIITAICGGTLRFEARKQGYLSVFAHSERCTGVTIRGLKYELNDAVLTNSFPLGVSNEFVGTECAVTVGSGTAIVVFDRL